MTVTWEDKQVIINFIAIVQRDIKAGRFGSPNFWRDGNMVKSYIHGAKFANVVLRKIGCRGGCMGRVTRQGLMRKVLWSSVEY